MVFRHPFSKSEPEAAPSKSVVCLSGADKEALESAIIQNRSYDAKLDLDGNPKTREYYFSIEIDGATRLLAERIAHSVVETLRTKPDYFGLHSRTDLAAIKDRTLDVSKELASHGDTLWKKVDGVERYTMSFDTEYTISEGSKLKRKPHVTAKTKWDVRFWFPRTLVAPSTRPPLADTSPLPPYSDDRDSLEGPAVRAVEIL